MFYAYSFALFNEKFHIITFTVNYLPIIYGWTVTYSLTAYFGFFNHSFVL